MKRSLFKRADNVAYIARTVKDKSVQFNSRNTSRLFDYLRLSTRLLPYKDHGPVLGHTEKNFEQSDWRLPLNDCGWTVKVAQRREFENSFLFWIDKLYVGLFEPKSTCIIKLVIDLIKSV